MPRFTQVLDDKRLAQILEECEEYQVSTGTGSPSDKQLAEEQLAGLGAYALPELVQELRETRTEREQFKVAYQQLSDLIDRSVKPAGATMLSTSPWTLVGAGLPPATEKVRDTVYCSTLQLVCVNGQVQENGHVCTNAGVWHVVGHPEPVLNVTHYMAFPEAPAV